MHFHLKLLALKILSKCSGPRDGTLPLDCRFFSEEYLLVLIIRDNIAVLPDSSDAHTSAQIIQA